MDAVETFFFMVGVAVVGLTVGTAAILAGAFALAYWLERRR